MNLASGDWRHQVRSWVIRHKHAIRHNQEYMGGNLNMRQRDEIASLCPGVPRSAIEIFVKENLDKFLDIDPFHIEERHGRKRNKVDANMFNGRNENYKPVHHVIPKKDEPNYNFNQPTHDTWQYRARMWTLSQKAMVRQNRLSLGVNFTSHQVMKLEAIFPHIPTDIIFKFITENIDKWFQEDDLRFMNEMNNSGKGKLICDPIPIMQPMQPKKAWQDKVYDWVKIHHMQIRSNREALGGNLTGNQSKQLEKLIPEIPYRFIFKIIATRMDDWLADIDKELREVAKAKLEAEERALKGESLPEASNDSNGFKNSVFHAPEPAPISNQFVMPPMDPSNPMSQMISSPMFQQFFQSMQTLQKQMDSLSNNSGSASFTNNDFWKHGVYTWIVNHRAHIKHNRRTYGGNLTVRQQAEIEQLCPSVPQAQLFEYFRSNVNFWLTSDLKAPPARPPPEAVKIPASEENIAEKSNARKRPKPPSNWRVGIEKYVKRHAKQIVKNRKNLGGNLSGKQHQELKEMYPQVKLRTMLQFMKKNVDKWISKYRSKSATPDDLIYAAHSKSTIHSVCQSLTVSRGVSATPQELAKPSLAKIDSYVSSEEDESDEIVETEEERTKREKREKLALEEIQNNNQHLGMPDHKVDIIEIDEGIVDKNEPLIMEWGTTNAPKTFNLADLIPKSPTPEPVVEKVVEKNVRAWNKKKKPRSSVKVWSAHEETALESKAVIVADQPKEHQPISKPSVAVKNEWKLEDSFSESEEDEIPKMTEKKQQISETSFQIATHRRDLSKDTEPGLQSVNSFKFTAPNSEVPTPVKWSIGKSDDVPFDFENMPVVRKTNPEDVPIRLDSKPKVEIHSENPVYFVESDSSPVALDDAFESPKGWIKDMIDESKSNLEDEKIEEPTTSEKIQYEKEVEVTIAPKPVNLKEKMLDTQNKLREKLHDQHKVDFTSVSENNSWSDMWKNATSFLQPNWSSEAPAQMFDLKVDQPVEKSKKITEKEWKNLLTDYVEKNRNTILNNHTKYNVYFTMHEKKEISALTDGIEKTAVFSWLNTNVLDLLKVNQMQPGYAATQILSDDQTWQDRVREYVMANYASITMNKQKEGKYFTVEQRVHLKKITENVPVKMISKFVHKWIVKWHQDNVEGSSKQKFQSIVAVLCIHTVQPKTTYQEWIDRAFPSLSVMDVRQVQDEVEILLRAEASSKEQWLSQKFQIKLETTEKPASLRHANVIQIRNPTKEIDFIINTALSTPSEKHLCSLFPTDSVLTIQNFRTHQVVTARLEDYLQLENLLKKNSSKMTCCENIFAFDLAFKNLKTSEGENSDQIQKCILKALPVDTIHRFNIINESRVHVEIFAEDVQECMGDEREFVNDVQYFLNKKYHDVTVEMKNTLKSISTSFFVENVIDGLDSMSVYDIFSHDSKDAKYQAQRTLSEIMSEAFEIDRDHFMKIKLKEHADEEILEIKCKIKVHDSSDAHLLSTMMYTYEALVAFETLLRKVDGLDSAVVSKDNVAHEVIILFGNPLKQVRKMRTSKLCRGIARCLEVSSKCIQVVSMEPLLNEGCMLALQIESQFPEDEIRFEVEHYINRKFPDLEIIEIS